jgi:UDP-N-acetylglucosamine--N-acetylmuramyl-(pentapeptide) pyrophosphoryl-undecaprenol N-acetylglucosamine transferase
MAQPHKLRRRWATRGQSERVDILLVSQPGGHLLELLGLHRAWRPFTHAWVTLDSVDTRSLLSSERVFLARGPTPRSVRNLVRNMVIAWRTLRRVRPTAILTTGSALAVPFAWVGRLLGVRTVYVECGGRADRPSLACRLVAPVATLIYVQWPGLERAVRHARYAGRVHISSIDELMLGASVVGPLNVAVFATVGTCPYPFDRLIRALDDLPDAEDVVVQTGVSHVRPTRAHGIDFLPFDELTAHIKQAGVVVTHGGIGSVLLALANGKRPIVVPRLPELGENVDDHQNAFVRGMAAEGLVTLLEDPEHLAEMLAAPLDAAAATGAASGESRLSNELFAYFDALFT